MLKEKIVERMKSAMKARDAVATDCMRMAMAAIKNREIEKRGELDDAECMKVLSSLAKQRSESIEMFKQGGRQDLVVKEEAELALIKSFLPEELSERDLLRLIEEAISETQAGSPRDMGRVMKALAPRIQGRADGKVVSELVRQKLS